MPGDWYIGLYCYGVIEVMGDGWAGWVVGGAICSAECRLPSM